MTTVVWDCCFLASAPASARVDRLSKIQEGKETVYYNAKLFAEYIKWFEKAEDGDLVSVFAFLLDSVGKRGKNSLSRQEAQKARDARWPGHDDHLIAAGLGGPSDRDLLTTEGALHATRTDRVLRHFRTHVLDS